MVRLRAAETYSSPSERKELGRAFFLDADLARTVFSEYQRHVNLCNFDKSAASYLRSNAMLESSMYLFYARTE